MDYLQTLFLLLLFSRANSLFLNTNIKRFKAADTFQLVSLNWPVNITVEITKYKSTVLHLELINCSSLFRLTFWITFTSHIVLYVYSILPNCYGTVRCYDFFTSSPRRLQPSDTNKNLLSVNPDKLRPLFLALCNFWFMYPLPLSFYRRNNDLAREILSIFIKLSKKQFISQHWTVYFHWAHSWYGRLMIKVRFIGISYIIKGLKLRFPLCSFYQWMVRLVNTKNWKLLLFSTQFWFWQQEPFASKNIYANSYK